MRAEYARTVQVGRSYKTCACATNFQRVEGLANSLSCSPRIGYRLLLNSVW